ncbi:hypothetical protein AB4212_46320, partial [Streptomyces sp. 2MCAF27]
TKTPTPTPTPTPVPTTVTPPTVYNAPVATPTSEVPDLDSDAYSDTDTIYSGYSDTDSVAGSDSDAYSDITDWDTYEENDPSYQDTGPGTVPLTTPKAGAPDFTPLSSTFPRPGTTPLPEQDTTPLPDPTDADLTNPLPDSPLAAAPSATPSTTPYTSPRGRDTTWDTGLDETLAETPDTTPAPDPLPDETNETAGTSGLPQSTGVPGDHAAAPNSAPAGSSPRPRTESETSADPESGNLPAAQSPQHTPEANPAGTPGRTPAATGSGNTPATGQDTTTRAAAREQDGTAITDEAAAPDPVSGEAAQPALHQPAMVDPVRDPVRPEQWRARQQ